MDNFHLQGVRKNIGKLNMSSQSCVENGEGGPIFLCVGGAKKNIEWRWGPILGG